MEVLKIVIQQLEQINGVEIYPIISLIIFFTFFVLVGYLVLTTPKSVIEEMSNLPLDEDNDLQDNNGIQN
ncbi:MAG: CcoQ/FixQ family Cbb3-type cytochrome c oxidase assembly chaperone [Bacteroidetes bacterium]|nr:MAG: CcoQ/FixQ family Cbb3-type cytochrome c oxidase assembly chaperone [Bacteroidota bacterium]